MTAVVVSPPVLVIVRGGGGDGMMPKKRTLKRKGKCGEAASSLFDVVLFGHLCSVLCTAVHT